MTQAFDILVGYSLLSAERIGRMHDPRKHSGNQRPVRLIARRLTDALLPIPDDDSESCEVSGLSRIQTSFVMTFPKMSTDALEHPLAKLVNFTYLAKIWGNNFRRQQKQYAKFPVVRIISLCKDNAFTPFCHSPFYPFRFCIKSANALDIDDLQPEAFALPVIAERPHIRVRTHRCTPICARSYR